MYINIKFLGGGQKISFLQISQNMVSDKTINKAFRIHKILLTNPLDTFFIFTIFKTILWL